MLIEMVLASSLFSLWFSVFLVSSGLCVVLF